MDEDLRDAMDGRPLQELYATDDERIPRRLSDRERHDLLDTAIRLVDGLYVHLPLKRAMYGIDPVQRLRLLRERSADMTARDVHDELSEIMNGLRDAHTRYVGPSEWLGMVAVLPFMIERFGSLEEPAYLASNVDTGHVEIDDPRFREGVELVYWNGMPIARAVERYADRTTGGRRDARLARATESMTRRALGYVAPPDAYWVDLVYRDLDGARRETRMGWRVVEVGAASALAATEEAGMDAYAADPAAEASRRAKLLLFAPEVFRSNLKRRRGEEPTAIDPDAAPPVDQWLTGRFGDNVAARRVSGPNGLYGHLRLWSFDLSDDDGFVAEVRDLMALMPRRGLIIDLRGNPGGLIWAAERLLQLFTPREIEPTSFSLLATDLTRTMAELPQNERRLAPWRASLGSAVVSGEPYSRSVPLTPPARCNDVGQVYPGPVLCIVDANTYSAGDLFAAGFVDNGLGPIVSIDRGTGAGGANVWRPRDIERALSGVKPPLPPRPAGIAYTISVRRAMRGGSAAGTVIEDVGVPAQFHREPTRDDLVEGNRDLLAFCAALLETQPATDLSVQRNETEVTITTQGLDRVDLSVDDRPNATRPIEEDGRPISIPLPATWTRAVVFGYAGQVLRQRRLLRP